MSMEQEHNALSGLEIEIRTDWNEYFPYETMSYEGSLQDISHHQGHVSSKYDMLQTTSTNKDSLPTKVETSYEVRLTAAAGPQNRGCQGLNSLRKSVDSRRRKKAAKEEVKKTKEQRKKERKERKEKIAALVTEIMAGLSQAQIKTNRTIVEVFLKFWILGKKPADFGQAIDTVMADAELRASVYLLYTVLTSDKAELKDVQVPEDLAQIKEKICAGMTTKHWRDDQCMKKFQSKSTRTIYDEYKKRNVRKKTVIDQIRLEYGLTMKQFALIFGSELKKGIKNEAVSTVFHNKPLFSRMFSKSHLRNALKRMDDQSKNDIVKNILNTLKTFTVAEMKAEIFDDSGTKDQYFKLPCSLLDNLDSLLEYLDKFRYRAVIEGLDTQATTLEEFIRFYTEERQKLEALFCNNLT